MRNDLLELDASVASRRSALRLTLEDAEAVRLLLSGGSVIDWHKAAFADHAAVDRLLRLHLLDPEEAEDRHRLRYLHLEAVSYLQDYVRVRVPPELREPDDVRDVFLWASDTSGFRRRQMLACMSLKLLHVLHHLGAADLRHRAAVSEAALLELAHQRVRQAADAMRASGHPLERFYGSKKTRSSMIAKLLAKRDDVAGRVFDKLRYRLVVPHEDDLIPTLAWLVRHLVPYNLALPGQSHNNLLDPASLADALPPADQEALQPLEGELRRADQPRNAFSGDTYRTINAVFDLPVRLPDAVLPEGPLYLQGRVVYVTMELQLVDEATDTRNELGQNAHEAYKQRQFEVVRQRLGRGRFLKPVRAVPTDDEDPGDPTGA